MHLVISMNTPLDTRNMKVSVVQTFVFMFTITYIEGTTEKIKDFFKLGMSDNYSNYQEM